MKIINDSIISKDIMHTHYVVGFDKYHNIPCILSGKCDGNYYWHSMTGEFIGVYRYSSIEEALSPKSLNEARIMEVEAFNTLEDAFRHVLRSVMEKDKEREQV